MIIVNILQPDSLYFSFLTSFFSTGPIITVWQPCNRYMPPDRDGTCKQAYIGFKFYWWVDGIHVYWYLRCRMIELASCYISTKLYSKQKRYARKKFLFLFNSSSKTTSLFTAACKAKSYFNFLINVRENSQLFSHHLIFLWMEASGICVFMRTIFLSLSTVHLFLQFLIFQQELHTGIRGEYKIWVTICICVWWKLSPNLHELKIQNIYINSQVFFTFLFRQRRMHLFIIHKNRNMDISSFFN